MPAETSQRQEAGLPSRRKLSRGRAAAYAVFVFGLFLFWFMALVDLSRGATLANPVTSAIFHLFARQYIAGRPDSGMGPSGFAGFFVATAGFAALRWGKGARRALGETLSLFASPMALVFEFGIWRYTPWFLQYQVTNFMAWTVDGTLVLSNSSVLLFSFLIMEAGLNWKLDRALGASRFRPLVLTVTIFASLIAFFVLGSILAAVYVPPPVIA